MKSSSSSRRITLRDLAEHLGLSKTTVSVVMSQAEAAEAIPEVTRKKIQRAAEELGYRPHHVARSLRRSRSMSIGIMAPEFSDGYFTLLMSGAESFLLSRDYFYFTVSHYWKPALLEQYPQALAERGVDGLLLLNTPIPHSPLPMVAVSGHHVRGGPPTVMLNHRKAAKLIMEHLHSLGHRRIAMMRGQSWSQDTDLRWKSLVSTARSYGIVVDEKLQMVLHSSGWTGELGYTPTKELLQQTRNFTAIVCFNDISAMGAIRALRDSGLRVPEDVSVVGFDNISTAGVFSPALTTIHQPLREMGYSAAELLIQRMSRTYQESVERLVHEPSLIVRESTGRARSQTRTILSRGKIEHL